MDCTNAIKKLSLKIFKQPLLPPNNIREIQEELRHSSTQIRAMKTIVSMIQDGYNMGVVCSDVLEIIDTKDAELKLLCNVYLRRNAADRPACQLMCTHTFLKDFNDRNWHIQRTAINDAVHLAMK